MRGVTEHVIWLTVGVIVTIIVLVLIYYIFPRTNCDPYATETAEEIKRAIECADQGGVDASGSPCNKATVRLCQEDDFSIFGFGYMQAYLGLMVPEYMVYYKQFPKKPVAGLFFGDKEGYDMKFSESYAFERSYTGQRPWDVRPTFTQLKEFFKTKYLEYPCTSENAFCLNIRGREEIVRLNAPDVTNVRIRRSGYGIAEEDPTFYLIAPCYATVTFTKDGSTVYGRVDKYNTDESNYCYTDEKALGALTAAYTGEVTCYVADFVATVLTCGSKAAIELSAKEALRESAVIITRESLEQATEYEIRTALKGSAKLLTPAFDEAIGKAAKAAAKESAEAAARQTTEEAGEKAAVSAAEASLRRTLGKDIIIEDSTYRAMSQRIGHTAMADVFNAEIKGIAAEAAKDAAAKAVTKDGRKEIQEKGIREAITNFDKGGKLTEEEINGIVKKAMNGELTQGNKAQIIAQALKSRGGKLIGIPPERQNAVQRMALKMVSMGVPIPCVDVDYCRGLGSCGEAMALWPGMPFAELTADDMRGKPTSLTAVDVFAECCLDYNYGKEKDIGKVVCDRPTELVDLVETDMGLRDESGKLMSPVQVKTTFPDGIPLSMLANYIGISNDSIPGVCSVSAAGEMSQTCLQSLEVRGAELDRCWDSSSPILTHTYDFGESKTVSSASISVVGLKDGCAPHVKIETSTDKTAWSEPMDERDLKAYDYLNDYTVKWADSASFRYLRLDDTSGCGFDYTFVSLDPYVETAPFMERGTAYPLDPYRYNYFYVPDDYSTKASQFCNIIPNCDSIALWIDADKSWEKYYDGNTNSDFTISPRDKIGIFTTKESSITLPVIGK